jgi:hypothetical protein
MSALSWDTELNYNSVSYNVHNIGWFEKFREDGCPATT